MTAGRPPNIMRSLKTTVYIPEDIKAKLDLFLFSAVEGRVPHGSYSKFFAERIREYFDPVSPAAQLAKFKQHIVEAELNGWSEDQKIALEAFRDHILGR